MIKSYHIDQIREYPQNRRMLLHEVTGRQLRDARQALGFSLAGLAARAGINRVCIRVYESHGDDVPNAHTHARRASVTFALRQHEGSILHVVEGSIPDVA